MSLQSISPLEAKRLTERDAILVDIRSPDEHNRERIPQARNIPIEQIGQLAVDAATNVVIFHCKAGTRTKANAPLLLEAARGNALILEGGIEAWKSAGLPVTQDKKQPIEIMRQVQIAAGGLVVAGATLGMILSPAFYVLSGLVGAGLVFAGITGSCTMAKILKVMPWNRATT